MSGCRRTDCRKTGNRQSSAKVLGIHKRERHYLQQAVLEKNGCKRKSCALAKYEAQKPTPNRAKMYTPDLETTGLLGVERKVSWPLVMVKIFLNVILKAKADKWDLG